MKDKRDCIFRKTPEEKKSAFAITEEAEYYVPAPAILGTPRPIHLLLRQFLIWGYWNFPGTGIGRQGLGNWKTVSWAYYAPEV